MSAVFLKLASVTKSLLSDELDYGKLTNAVIALKKLFCEAAGFDELADVNQQNIQTASGKAIAPRWAASCLDDMMRTRSFILGIRDAIEEKLRLNAGRPVTVLYAGAGPFATLLTPLITCFSSEQVKMVLIEINPVSIRHLQKMILHIGMEEYIIDVVQADAVNYSIPDDQQPDILVSETMNNALQREPQVSIVANLMSQCSRQPFLIPEQIKIEACLIGDPLLNPSSILSLNTLLELDVQTAIQIKNDPDKVQALSPGVQVTIPSRPDPLYKQLALCTTIRIFRQHVIRHNESGLTIPQILMMISSIKKFPVRMLFQYCISDTPGFKITDASEQK
ncbi:MAG: hypothetical protein ACRDEB_05415 [Chitinophagaceae bacterium]